MLWGLGQISPALQAWINGASVDTATIGGFFCIALAATGAGLTASTVRWLTIDTLHHATGVRPPHWNFSRLAERTDAFHLLIEIHYKYYQFYANSVVALLFAYGAWRSNSSLATRPIGLADIGTLAIAVLFFVGSRDTLTRYYHRAGALLQADDTEPLITLVE